MQTLIMETPNEHIHDPKFWIFKFLLKAKAREKKALFDSSYKVCIFQSFNTL